MSYSEYKILTDGYQGSPFKLLSISQIGKGEYVRYFVIRYQNTTTKHFCEKVIDMDSDIHCCETYHYNTDMRPTRELDYDEEIKREDGKFVPQSHIPGDEDRTWVFDTLAQLHITHANLKVDTQMSGGFITFTILTTPDLGDALSGNTLLWKLHIKNEHNGYYSHRIMLITAKGNGADPFCYNTYVL